MPDTTHMNWTYPAFRIRPWHDEFVSLIAEIDDSVYNHETRITALEAFVPESFNENQIAPYPIEIKANVDPLNNWKGVTIFNTEATGDKLVTFGLIDTDSLIGVIAPGSKCRVVQTNATRKLSVEPPLMNGMDLPDGVNISKGSGGFQSQSLGSEIEVLYWVDNTSNGHFRVSVKKGEWKDVATGKIYGTSTLDIASATSLCVPTLTTPVGAGLTLTLLADQQFTIIGSSGPTLDPYHALVIRNPQDSDSINDFDNRAIIQLWPGTTTDHHACIEFCDHTGYADWTIGKNQSSVFVLYNASTLSIHRFWFEDTDPLHVGLCSGDSDINSEGTGAVKINYHGTDECGTGGLEVFSGGTPNKRLFSVKNLIPGGCTGFGTSTPNQRIDVQSGAMQFSFVSAPSGASVTFASGGAGSNTPGVHYAKFAAVNALGETELGAASRSYTVSGAGEEWVISNVPVSLDPSVTHIRVYITKAGGSTYYRAGAGYTIVNGVTTFSINIVDTSLVITGYSWNKTSGIFFVGSLRFLSVDSLGSIVLGGNGGYSLTSAPGITHILAGSQEYIDFRNTAGSLVWAMFSTMGFTVGNNLPYAGSTNVLQLANGTAPTAHVDDTIQLFSVDSSDSKATLGIFTEQDVEDIGTFTPTKKVKIKWNSVEYWAELDPVT